jgi:hypothetical protein
LSLPDIHAEFAGTLDLEVSAAHFPTIAETLFTAFVNFAACLRRVSLFLCNLNARLPARFGASHGPPRIRRYSGRVRWHDCRAVYGFDTSSRRMRTQEPYDFPVMKLTSPAVEKQTER